jgi:hypothetical protein
MTLAERFWSKVERRGSDDCWLWTAATNERGYGVMRPEGRRSGPTIKAHRVSAHLAGMQIDGLAVLHRCDNPPCVNPAHLRLGTQLANVDDMVRKGRQNRGSARPHSKLTEADIPVIRNRLAAGELHRAIAADYGVSRSRISSIASGRNWRHVLPAVADSLTGEAVA